MTISFSSNFLFPIDERFLTDCAQFARVRVEFVNNERSGIRSRLFYSLVIGECSSAIE